MTRYATDWTTRITATLALALAAGCTPAADGNLLAEGTLTAAQSEEGDGATFAPNTEFQSDDQEPQFKEVDLDHSDEEGDLDDPSEDEDSNPDSTDVPEADDSETRPPAVELSAELCVAEPSNAASIADCVALVTNRGGVVEVPAGEYEITKSIRVPSGVDIVGSGASTVVSLEGDAQAPVFIVGSAEETPTSITEEVSIRDLSIFGSAGDQASDTMAGAPWLPVAGIVVRSARDVTIDNVLISETASSGVMVDANSESVSLSRVTVLDALFDGITVQASSDVHIKDAMLEGNAGAGISFDWGVEDSSVSGSTVMDNGYEWAGGDNPGIYLAMSTRVDFTRNSIVRNDGNGVVLTNQGMATDPTQTCSSENRFIGNDISENGQFAFWLSHDTCASNSAVDNTLRGNAWGPVFEPVTGQLDLRSTTCEGAGCGMLSEN